MTTFYVQSNVDDITGTITTVYFEDLPQQDVLLVPYHSQWEGDARKFTSDCGPATVEMVGEYWTSEDHTTDEIMSWITDVNRSTSSTELIKAAEHFYDVKLTKQYNSSWEALKTEIKAKKPVIVLVHYGSFLMRLDRGYTSGHWMVVVGFDEVDYQGTKVERIILHDPDWWGNYTTQGESIPIIKYHFTQMWKNCYLDGNPNYFALYSESL